MNKPISQAGFNGEHHDRVLQQYILGNGYRAYNPMLQRFTSPDSMSPFGKGGINLYAYCAGDPINNIDPTGHFKISGGEIFGLAVAGLGLGLAVFTGGSSLAVAGAVLGVASAGLQVVADNTSGTAHAVFQGASVVTGLAGLTAGGVEAVKAGIGRSASRSVEESSLHEQHNLSDASGYINISNDYPIVSPGEHINKKLSLIYSTRPSKLDIYKWIKETTLQKQISPDDIYHLRINSLDSPASFYMESSKGRLIPDGDFFFVNSVENPSEILCAPYSNYNNETGHGHTSLTNGGDVHYAGGITFSNGNMLYWNNHSGHYKPSFEPKFNAYVRRYFHPPGNEPPRFYRKVFNPGA